MPHAPSRKRQTRSSDGAPSRKELRAQEESLHRLFPDGTIFGVPIPDARTQAQEEFAEKHGHDVGLLRMAEELRREGKRAEAEDIERVAIHHVWQRDRLRSGVQDSPRATFRRFMTSNPHLPQKPWYLVPTVGSRGIRIMLDVSAVSVTRVIRDRAAIRRWRQAAEDFNRSDFWEWLANRRRRAGTLRGTVSLLRELAGGPGGSEILRLLGVEDPRDIEAQNIYARLRKRRLL